MSDLGDISSESDQIVRANPQQNSVVVNDVQFSTIFFNNTTFSPRQFPPRYWSPQTRKQMLSKWNICVGKYGWRFWQFLGLNIGKIHLHWEFSLATSSLNRSTIARESRLITTWCYQHQVSKHVYALGTQCFFFCPLVVSLRGSHHTRKIHSQQTDCHLQKTTLFLDHHVYIYESFENVYIYISVWLLWNPRIQI